MTAHVLDVHGDDCLTGRWWCRRCGSQYLYYVQALEDHECMTFDWPWPAERVDRFRATVRSLHTDNT